MIRLLAGLVMTALLLAISNPREVGAALAGADRGWVLLAAALALTDRVVMAHRWYLTLDRRARAALGFRTVLAASFRTSFLGTFIPTSFGTELLRVLAFRHQGVDGLRATAAVIVDRYMGVLSMLGMALVGIALAPELVSDRTVRAALIAVAAIGAAGAAAIVLRPARAIAFRVSGWLAPGRWRRRIRRIVTAVARYQRRPGTLGGVWAESMAVQLLRVGAAAAVGRSLGLDLTFTTYLTLAPLALLVLMLPFSAGGLGTIQAAFILLFGRVGVGRADAFTLATVLLFLGILSAVPGGFLPGSGPARAPSLDGSRTR
jgi:uncharacterized protein (TIRG00374 family)